MRVAIVDSQIAFFHGGAEMLCSGLSGAIRALGHDVEIVRLPFNPADPRDIGRLIDFSLEEDLGRYIARPDIVIALRFPAYLVQHPGKRIWLLHQLRQYYEYYEETLASGNASLVPAMRERIREVDRKALGSNAGLWAMSRRVAARAAADIPGFAKSLMTAMPSR